MARTRSSARPLAYAVALSLIAMVPVAFLLYDDGERSSTTPIGTAAGRIAGIDMQKAPDPRSAPTVSSSGLELMPPPPRTHPKPTRTQLPISSGHTQEEEKAGPPPSVRLVALRRLERKRPEETVEEAEALVRDTAREPAERTVLISALGILQRVPGGESALVRLSSDPPTPEVGRMASDLLMRPR